MACNFPKTTRRLNISAATPPVPGKKPFGAVFHDISLPWLLEMQKRLADSIWRHGTTQMPPRCLAPSLFDGWKSCCGRFFKIYLWGGDFLRIFTFFLSSRPCLIVSDSKGGLFWSKLMGQLPVSMEREVLGGVSISLWAFFVCLNGQQHGFSFLWSLAVMRSWQPQH